MNAVQFVRATFIWILAIPLTLVCIGAMSNQAVLIANHGKFPVMLNGAAIAEERKNGPLVDDMLDREHCLMTSKTHLNALADIFDFGDAVYSIGDGFIELGEYASGFVPFAWFMIFLAKNGVRKEDQ